MYGATASNGSEADPTWYHRPGSDSSMPSLVMLHGLFGKLTNFEPCLPLLLPQIDLWVPELPLYGTHDHTDSIKGLAEWLSSWLRSNGIESAVLLGNSLGGHVALQCALSRDETVCGLVLVGSSGLFEDGFGVSLPRRFDREYIRSKASEAFHNYSVDDEMVDEIHSIITNRPLLGKLVRLARSARRESTEPFLAQIDLPTCVIWGEYDRITPAHVARKFHHLIPRSELHWIADCGHVPMLEQPTFFASVLNDFMRSYAVTPQPLNLQAEPSS